MDITPYVPGLLRSGSRRPAPNTQPPAPGQFGFRRGHIQEPPLFAMEQLETAMRRSRDRIISLQKPDGHWVFDLEADVTIPSEYVLFHHFLNRPMAAGLQAKLGRYIMRRQLDSGGWALYTGGKGEISASVKAYFALKLLGHSPDAAHMTRARRFIRGLGGAETVNVFTRIMLALFGQIPWQTVPAIPAEIMLLPEWSFFHIRKISYWSRTVIVPLLILYAKKPVCPLRPEQGVAELFLKPPTKPARQDRFGFYQIRKNLFLSLDRLLKWAEPLLDRSVRQRGVACAEQWMCERMTGQGGIGAIFPAMVNAAMALKSLGYPDDHPLFTQTVAAVNALLVDREDEAFPQPCVSPVWDTSLSLLALFAGGIGPDHPSIPGAVQWCLDKQILTAGDWTHRAPDLPPGGWGFQYENSFYPDMDDTPVVIMALLKAGAAEKEEYRDRLKRAVKWVLGMQSSDGGWGAFDIDNNALYLNDIPFADHGALLDPSTADVTARCMTLLSMLGYDRNFAPMQKALRFILRQQERSGAWFGRWGVNYIYGTCSVLAALAQMKEDPTQAHIRRAAAWLKSVQNEDKGWGETCASYSCADLAGKGESTASQTAWALMGLMAAGEAGTPEVQGGIHYLLSTQQPSGSWDEPHYTGTGFPNVFYLRYHGYSEYFPLWALGMYRNIRHRIKNGSKGRPLKDILELGPTLEGRP